MAVPRWICVAFLLTLSLELCSSHRPLTLDGAMNNETKADSYNIDTISKNVVKGGDIGTERANNNCSICNQPECLIRPPDIVPTPCEPPHNCKPLPPCRGPSCVPPIIIPPIHNEPCLPPVPPIIGESPFNYPVMEPCLDSRKMNAAMEPAPTS